ncbi:DUF2851 family protein [soil metagenome]
MRGISPADRYADLRACGRVQERALFPATRQPGELELQARWFAGDFGQQFSSVCGRTIDVVQFGVWNREAGPDFHDAVIRIDGQEVQRGSIEFDLSDRSWETHGHATNPAFEETVLHVFVHASGEAFFTRTLSHRNVLQVRVDPRTLPESFAANVPLARPGRCQAPLHGLPEERVLGVITGAAQFRLQRKTARLRRMRETHGRDETLFQEVAAALGYKNNKLPFTLIAQRLSLAALRAQPDDAEALLFGVAGFLREPDLSVYKSGTRAYLRTLWERWWPHRDSMQRLVLAPELWRLTGARPLNHPQRRLGALAALVPAWGGLIHSLGKSDTAAAAVRKFLAGVQHPFWEQHYTLTSEPAPKPMALLGDSRIAEILANVVLPLLAGEGTEIWDNYASLPAQLTNRRLETAVARLFGSDPRRRHFVRTIAQQQGLLQIYEDFCLQDNSDCLQCPFPEQMQKWS